MAITSRHISAEVQGPSRHLACYEKRCRPPHSTPKTYGSRSHALGPSVSSCTYAHRKRGSSADRALKRYRTAVTFRSRSTAQCVEWQCPHPRSAIASKATRCFSALSFSIGSNMPRKSARRLTSLSKSSCGHCQHKSHVLQTSSATDGTGYA